MLQYSRNQVYAMKLAANQHVHKAISGRRALADLEKFFEIEDVPTLFKWYRQEYNSLAAERYSFSEDKYKALTGLLGLVFERFWSASLPVPKNLLMPGDLADTEYLFSSIGGWVAMGSSSWNDEYQEYCDGKLRGEKFLNEDFSLRWDLCQDFAGAFLGELEPLLQGDSKETVAQTADRHVKLRKLVSEVEFYPPLLAEVLKKKVTDLKPKELFAKFCFDFLVKALGGYEQTDHFQREIVNFYWSELEGALKDEEQKRVVQVLRADVDTLLNDLLAEGE